MKKIIMMGNVDALSYGQITDETHIKNAFLELGHQVIENDSSIEVLKDADLILAFKSNKIGDSHIRDWKSKTNTPVFIWSFDNMDRFQWFYPIAKECDLWLGEELGRQCRWKEEDIPFYYFPFHAEEPKNFYPIESEKIYDVTFMGTPYDTDTNDKFEILRAVQEKFDLHVFGNNPGGWTNQGMKNVHEPAFDKESSKIISQSKIVLAISNCRVPGYWSIRQSQILMCGGFGLVRYTPHMEKESRDHVIYWNNKEDLIENIGYYLDKPAERDEIAKKGYIYALSNLTPVQRVKELLIILENYKKNPDLFKN